MSAMNIGLSSDFTGSRQSLTSYKNQSTMHALKTPVHHDRAPRNSTIECRSAGSDNRGSGGGRRFRQGAPRLVVRSDGEDHLGSSQSMANRRPFPGPPSGEGPPLRVLPIGGLGEIGMNCMLVGVYDRYILIDAGLMFPDFTDLGMQKILPDTSFLAQWRDRIEAVIITHGHEDHIGAMPWVIPALDPDTPIYAGGFPMQLIKRRMQEFNMWDENRCHTLNMREPFQLGPFMAEAFRVTHSIPDCCGVVLRSDHGTILHTGDWKIDENPVDGEGFDREFLEQVSREGVALMMSDSTNVLSPGRTTGEASVEKALINRVMGHQGKGRVITTQFASNLHRLTSVKRAADAAGRKICFIGMSLNMYLEAAFREGRAPMDPKDLVPQSAIDDMDPNELLIVTTGSQAEPRAALSLASREASHLLRLRSSDLVLYSAKIIPGNDTRVVQMMNRIAELGPELAMGRDEGLHTSGHAYQGELEEALRLTKPQHFLPVHGEYAFLCAHAQLAQNNGVNFTSVIRNGQMLGVHERRNSKTISTGSLAAVVGEAKLINFYNDGNKGTGTATEMALEERQLLAVEGIVIAAVDVIRNPAVLAAGAAAASGEPAALAAAAQAAARRKLKARIRITTRALWVDNGRLLERLHGAAEAAIAKLPGDATLLAVERTVSDGLRRACKQFNNRRPDVVVVAHEADPRAGAAAAASAAATQRAEGRRTSMSDREAAALLQEKERRRRQQREKDLLFAGKGGEVSELGASTTMDESSSDEETQSDSEGGNAVGGSAAAEEATSRSTASRMTQQKRAPSTGRVASSTRRDADGAEPRVRRTRASSSSSGSRSGPPVAEPLPKDFIQTRRAANPRDSPDKGGNTEYP